jgi:hypothetical protein
MVDSRPVSWSAERWSGKTWFAKNRRVIFSDKLVSKNQYYDSKDNPQNIEPGHKILNELDFGEVMRSNRRTRHTATSYAHIGHPKHISMNYQHIMHG